MQTQNTNPTPQTTTEHKPDSVRRSPEAKPDFYARLIAGNPAEKAAGILAALCRRKDKAIRLTLTAHHNGETFDDAIIPLRAVYAPKQAAA
jgi:hypothetical protein